MRSRSSRRRLVEVLVDFVLVCGSFLAAYLLVVGGKGTELQRGTFLAALPVVLGVRYVAFIAFRIYRRVWRYATSRDALAIAAAVLRLRARRLRHRRGDAIARPVPGACLPGRRGAVHRAGDGLAARAEGRCPQLQGCRCARPRARPRRRRRRARPQRRPRAARVRAHGWSASSTTTGVATTPHRRRDRARRGRRDRRRCSSPHDPTRCS